MINGYCQKCKSWLGREAAEVKIEKDLDNVFIIGQLLENTSQYYPFNKEIIQKNLRSLYEIIPSPKREYLEKNIGISDKQISRYISGDSNGLTIQSFINICLYYQISMRELITNYIDFSLEVRDEKKINRLRKYKRVDVRKLESDLKEYLKLTHKRKAPISILYIAEQLGVSDFTLIKYFPELIDQLKEINRKYRADVCIKRKNERMELVREETIKLFRSGIYPSFRKVNSKLPFTITGFEKIYRDKWEETILELGLSQRVNQYN
ncbi:hypothetical protein [Cytobacillus sp. Bac17]|nr:hypothetical protein [Cytobacillus sp. Bac17]